MTTGGEIRPPSTVKKHGTDEPQNGETVERSVNTMGLYEFFCDVPDETADMVWRVYNSNNHGSLITEDYTKLPYPMLKELDNAPVVSYNVRTTKKGHYMAVYVRF